MAYFLSQTRSRSEKNIAVLSSPGGSRQRRLPRLVKCRRFPTVCSRKYTQLTRLTLSLPLTSPKLTPDDIASLTWVCENFEVSLHPTPVPVTHPSGSPPMSLRHREGRHRERRACLKMTLSPAHSVRLPQPPVCHNSNFNISQFFILNAENSSFPISSKYDFTILAIPLCATKRYVLSGCAFISSSRLYIRCAR